MVPLVSGARPSMWLESSVDDTTLGMMDRLPLIMALRSPLEESSTMVGDRTHAGVDSSKAVGDSLADGGRSAATSLVGAWAHRPVLAPT